MTTDATATKLDWPADYKADIAKQLTSVVKPPRLRMFIYCSTDSFEKLALIGSRWIRCIAAQQSNLVNEAEQLADDAQRRAPSDYMKHRANWECANQVDVDRLRRLVNAWPSLSRRQQEDLVDQFELVIGE